MPAGFFRSGCKALRCFWTKSVRRQLILGIALVHATLMTGFVLDLVSRQQTFLHQESIAQATSLAEALAASSASWVLSDDLVGLEELVDSLKNAPGLEYSMVLDGQCRVLAHTARQHVGMYVSDQISLGLLDGGSTARLLAGNRNLIDIAVPVLANGKSIGWARVSLNQSGHRASLVLVTRNGIIYTLAAIVIGTVMAVFISKGLTLGLANLVSLSAQVQAGVRNIRADEQRIDEIGALARGFNRMLGSIEDSERSLTDSLNWKRTILDTSAAGILVVSGKRVIKEANPRLFSMFGYTPEELIGKTTETLHVSHESFLAFEDNVYSLTARQEIVDVECPLQTQDGLPLWCKISGRAIDPSDLDKGVIWVLTDITERKRVEEERARINAVLEAKNAELEQMVYIVSHDLRSPLVNIDGYSKELGYAFEDLRRTLASLQVPEGTLRVITQSMEDDFSEPLRFIRTSTARMETLLSGLLRLSRSGRAPLTIETLDMNVVVSTIIDATEFALKVAGITLEVAGLPPCQGDANQVAQVFSNLLDNAMKYLDPSRPGVIRLHGRTEQGRSVYCVEDNGIGIAADHLGKIFEIFQRIDPEHGKGEGLGLTIVRRILTRLNGDVWVESEVGLGSRFYVALPAETPQ